MFTIGAYTKEIQQILDTQKKYHAEIADEFCEKYLKIFTRKRKYYEEWEMKNQERIMENTQQD